MTFTNRLTLIDRISPGKKLNVPTLAAQDTTPDYELLTAVTGVIHQCAADVRFFLLRKKRF